MLQPTFKLEYSKNQHNFPTTYGSFYPFYILTKIQTLSEFEPKIAFIQRKKDNFKDKKRIERIIFLKVRGMA